MTFSNFCSRMFAVTSAGSSTGNFVHTLFYYVVNEEGQPLLEGYAESSYRGFFNGASITGIAKKINIYIDPTSFEEYIGAFQDCTVINICEQFKDVIPEIDAFNAGKKLSELFVVIIKEAAGIRHKIKAESPETFNDDSEDSAEETDYCNKSEQSVHATDGSTQQTGDEETSTDRISDSCKRFEGPAIVKNTQFINLGKGTQIESFSGTLVINNN